MEFTLAIGQMEFLIQHFTSLLHNFYNLFSTHVCRSEYQSFCVGFFYCSLQVGEAIPQAQMVQDYSGPVSHHLCVIW